MRNRLIGLMICDLFVGAIHAGESFQAEIEQLKTIHDVTGRAVYFEGGPGAFFKLSKIFLERGKEEDFLKLTTDESPVVRSMGLLCLAQNGMCVQTLKEHLSDNGIVGHFPLGCVGTRITVGSFVRKLLHDPSHLGHLGSHHPLLSENGLIGLDIEILAKDSTTSFHHDAREALSEALAKKKLSLTLPDLKARVPNLETYQVVKAVGRLGISPTTGTFLLSCVRNKNLDADSRLAAASALTRSKSERIVSMIERQTAYLDNPEGRRSRDHLLEAAQNRASHEKLMTAIRTERTTQGPEGIKDKVIAAFSNSHPLMLQDLGEGLPLAHSDEDVRAAFRKSLIDMAKNLEQFNQTWNTYSDAAYWLLFEVNAWKERFEGVFTQTDLSELEKNIQKAVENHLEGKSNRWNMR
jgi:hypothetical protein